MGEISAQGYQKLVQILGDHRAKVNVQYEDTDRVKLRRGVDFADTGIKGTDMDKSRG